MSLSPTATLVDLPLLDHKSSFLLDGSLEIPLDSSMSLPVDTNDFSLLSSSFNLKPVPTPAFTLPSPPASNYSTDNSLDFDIESFTHCSPASDFAFDSTGFAASPPESTTLISPKSSVSAPFSSVPFGDSVNLPSSTISLTDPIAAEALSNHHLQRYFHYKALAAQAEAAAACQQDQFDAFVAFTMVGDDRSFNPSYPSQPQQQQYFGLPAQSFDSGYSVGAPQPQATAAAMHAQAQAHMQAHDIALARAQEQRSLSMSYYMPAATQRLSFEALPQAPMQPQPMWSRHSVASSITSPPFPSTPQNVAPALPVAMSKTTANASAPNVPAPAVLVESTRIVSEGEAEMEDELESAGGSDDQDESSESMSVANPHGGGRGYVPGKTPDDPKKKHKCSICGRGFARAFNLKSHIQTHNPTRSKPHQCPHPSCKRGFSRLHDLERHRQGIHSDGPLVDAKRHGVPPAVARAQSRIARRAANGSLI